VNKPTERFCEPLLFGEAIFSLVTFLLAQFFDYRSGETPPDRCQIGQEKGPPQAISSKLAGIRPGDLYSTVVNCICNYINILCATVYENE